MVGVIAVAGLAGPSQPLSMQHPIAQGEERKGEGARMGVGRSLVETSCPEEC